MSILTIIPARLAATRLPEKPLADINGMPMIVHVMKRALEANIGPVVVACCSEKIKQTVESYGGTAIITDPNLPSGTDRVYAAAEIFDPNARYQLIINLQGDLPLIDSRSLVILAEHMKKANHDLLTLAAPIDHKDDYENPNIVKIAMSPVALYECARAHYFSRSSVPYNATKAFHHIGIYGYKREILKRFVSLAPSLLEIDERLEQLRALEDGIMIHAVTVNQAPQSVDTPDDLEKVRKLDKERRA